MNKPKALTSAQVISIDVSIGPADVFAESVVSVVVKSPDKPVVAIGAVDIITENIVDGGEVRWWLTRQA